MSDIIQNKLERLIVECDKHQLRIESAYRKAESILPLNAEKSLLLDESNVEHIDQFLFRFLVTTQMAPEKYQINPNSQHGRPYAINVKTNYSN